MEIDGLESTWRHTLCRRNREYWAAPGHSESLSRNRNRTALASSVLMVVFTDRETPVTTMIVSESNPFSKNASYDPTSSDLRSKYESFHGQREAIFLVRTGYKSGSMSHI